MTHHRALAKDIKSSDLATLWGTEAGPALQGSAFLHTSFAHGVFSGGSPQSISPRSKRAGGGGGGGEDGCRACVAHHAEPPQVGSGIGMRHGDKPGVQAVVPRGAVVLGNGE